MKIIYILIYILLITFVIINIIDKLNNKCIEKYTNIIINNNQTITYSQFKEYYPKLHYLNRYTKLKIPKFIFRTSNYKLSEVPSEIGNILSNTLENNPDYIQVYFQNDNDIDIFIKEYYPNYFDLYKSVKPGAFKADIFRLLVIYRYGGIYNDIGHKYIVPINDIIKDNDEIVFIVEPHDHWGVFNGMIAAYKKHPIILFIIEYIMNNIKNKHYGIDSLDITGPKAVGRALNKYLNNSEDEFWIEPKIIEYKNFIINLSYRHYYADNDEGYIVDKDFKPLVSTKFPNYYNIMYSNSNNIHYNDYWKNNDVYS